MTRVLVRLPARGASKSRLRALWGRAMREPEAAGGPDSRGAHYYGTP